MAMLGPRPLWHIGVNTTSLTVICLLLGCSTDQQPRLNTVTSSPSIPPATHSQKAVYYVATTGSDANPGTETQPFRTLAHGVIVLAPGDTLNILSGTYAESLLDNIPGRYLLALR